MTLLALLAAAALSGSIGLQVDPNRPPQTAPTPVDCRGWMFGSLLRAPGDADGDGVPDLVVADPGLEKNRCDARAWLLSGKDFRVLLSRPLEHYAAARDLAIVGIADHDGDGRLDWLASASWWTRDEEVAPAVLSGRDGRVIEALTWTDGVPGGLARDWSDRASRPRNDAFLTRPDRARGGDPIVHVDADGDGTLDAATGGLGRLEVRSARDGLTLWKREGHSGFGIRIAALSDVDGDRCSDLAVASPHSGVGEGTVEALSGRTGKRLFLFATDLRGWWWGSDLAAIGDLDGDGFVDLALGTNHDHSHEPGLARISSGRDGRPIATLLRAGDSISVERAR